ncbi:MAG: malate synthase G, partial [Pseudomonadota bacterium]
MTKRAVKDGLQVDPRLVDFLEADALPGTGITPEVFWSGLSKLIREFGPKNRALLETRATMQSQIDAWHLEQRGKPHDHEA